MCIVVETSGKCGLSLITISVWITAMGVKFRDTGSTRMAGEDCARGSGHPRGREDTGRTKYYNRIRGGENGLS